MALGKVPKIYIGWASIIAIGLGGFVLARNSVTKNRSVIMKTRERIRDQARAEQEESRVSCKVEDESSPSSSIITS